MLFDPKTLATQQLDFGGKNIMLCLVFGFAFDYKVRLPNAF